MVTGIEYGPRMIGSAVRVIVSANTQIEETMLKSAVFASLLVTSLIAIPVVSEARPVAPESAPAISNILPVQGGYWEHCRMLRERIREIEGRLYSAPPWERPRLERRLYERREGVRARCRRHLGRAARPPPNRVIISGPRSHRNIPVAISPQRPGGAPAIHE